MPVRKDNQNGPPTYPNTVDVARYIADMTVQLEGMAISAKLDLLAYFLGMAKAESELFVRMNSAPDDSSAAFDEGTSSQDPFGAED